MSFDTVGPAVLATLDARHFIVTDQMTTSFVCPTSARSFTGRGRIVRRKGDALAVDAELVEAGSGTVVATAQARLRVVPR